MSFTHKKTWAEQFAPVSALGRDLREGQALLGQAVIDSIRDGGSLLAEAGTGTGKSFATLIPAIHAAIDANAHKRPFKAVISTETLTLQTQLVDKDLPFLASLYKGFTYRKLMGRTNYVCLNQARINARGDAQLSSILETLKIRQDNLGDGELRDVERVLNKDIEPDTWKELTGSSKFCGDNQCTVEKCYGTLARAKALVADIVVCNHAILATDIEMKTQAGGGAFADGILGQIDCLIVDEGHKLEPVLVDQWTKKLSDWELQDQTNSVITALDLGQQIKSNFTVKDNTARALLDLEAVMKNIRRFYMAIAEKNGEKWEKASLALSEKIITGSDPSMLALMREYEEENPTRLLKAEQNLEKAIEYLKLVCQQAAEDQASGRRKMNKGHRAAKDLLDTVRIITKALSTRDGIVSQYGAFGARVDGWRRGNGEPGLSIHLVPLDVSPRAKMLWVGVKTTVLLSATLTDLTNLSNPFSYARTCVAFPDGKELKVGTPFDLKNQQLVYVTKADGNKASVERAEFDFDEMISLIHASKGRALVLFTSRAELDWTAAQVRYLQSTGAFPYQILVQEKDVNKDKLATAFKEDISSVLFATKSFFTGFDAPGETLSLVLMAKFPNLRWSVECQQQVAHWRRRGFHNWYTRASLTDLEQAFGRLVRSSGCKGVLGMLDFRSVAPGHNVAKTAQLGITATGSPITQDIEVVRAFLN